ncbi:MAG: U32 family peptidase [Nanoarchaeota archaeon]|nr:U32 family peptidase [Nanoarchaeota archaeon]
MKSDYELLAPVGDFKNLYAAVEAGADAVYFGIKRFNMRANAKNFNVRDLRKVRRICGSSPRKPKMYLTLNAIVYDCELKKLEGVVKAVKGKVDAIICWDISVIGLCKKYGVPFHISTQASVSNVVAAKFYKGLGAERIVLARELNLKQIKKVSRVISVECFCHGAMCVAVSGRCFTSQFVHGISANRGQCAQPCRRIWEVKDDGGNELKLENNRVMSAKDLCTLPFIENMKKAGIKSFKIEGRNRSPEYVSTVVSEYRKALDKKLSRGEIIKGIARLKKVYNRGFSSGFYFKMPTADDFSFSEHGEQEERKEFVGKIEKYWPKAKATSVKMFAGRLKVDDDVYLISKNAPIQRAIVKSIEFKSKNVKIAKKGQEVGVDFGIAVKRGDEVYVIKKTSQV